MKRYLLVTMMTILAFGLAAQSDMYSCFWKKKAKPAPSTNIEQSDIKSGSETQSSSQGHAQAGLQPVSYLAGGVNSFAFDLYNRSKSGKDNLFFSPFSIYTAFSMVYGGAEGLSRKEIQEIFSYHQDKQLQHKTTTDLMNVLNSLKESGKVDLAVSNSMFCDEKYESKLKDDYLKLLKDLYQSEFFLVSYENKKAAVERINGWIEEKTNNRIKDILSEDHIDEETALSIVNAIFFKANWYAQFDSKLTREEKFYPDPQKRSDFVKAKLMHMKGMLSYNDVDGVQLLELPYEEEDLSMLVLLPRDMDKLETQLTTSNLEKWISGIQTQEVKAWLPKFEMTLTLDGLSNSLKEMGMLASFDKIKANFNGIFHLDKNENLYIQEVLHKAFIEVNEEGSEAAAATVVVFGLTRAGGPNHEPPIPEFRADKPFIFMIRHKPSDTILFMGKVVDPTKP